MHSRSSGYCRGQPLPTEQREISSPQRLRGRAEKNDPTPPFDLDFDFPPIGWPSTTTHSSPAAITLALPPGPRTKFKISTSSGDGSTTVKTEGYLTVT